VYRASASRNYHKRLGTWFMLLLRMDPMDESRWRVKGYLVPHDTRPRTRSSSGNSRIPRPDGPELRTSQPPRADPVPSR